MLPEVPNIKWIVIKGSAPGRPLFGANIVKQFYLLGLGYERGDMAPYGGGCPYFIIVFPYWLILSSCMLLPAICIMEFAKRSRIGKRRKLGLCSYCGYDLRGLSLVENCPECG